MTQELVEKYIDIFARKFEYHEYNPDSNPKNYENGAEYKVNIEKAIQYYNKILGVNIPESYFFYYKFGFNLVLPGLSIENPSAKLFDNIPEHIKKMYLESDYLLESNKDLKEFYKFPDYFIIFSNVGNGDLIYFNYNDLDKVSGEPSCYYYDHEYLPVDEEKQLIDYDAIDYSKEQKYSYKIADNYQDLVIKSIRGCLTYSPELKLPEDKEPDFKLFK